MEILDHSGQSFRQGNTILIIENDSLSVLLITEYLSNTLVRLIHVTNLEALTSFINEHIDLIIKGIGIREFREGLSLVKKIKQQNPGIPILAHSACVYEEDIEACYRAGCNGFIPKPIDFEYFTKILNNYLGA